MFHAESWRDSNVLSIGRRIEDKNVCTLHAGALSPGKPLDFMCGLHLDKDWPSSRGCGGLRNVDSIGDGILPWGDEVLQLGEGGSDGHEKKEDSKFSNHFEVSHRSIPSHKKDSKIDHIVFGYDVKCVSPRSPSKASATRPPTNHLDHFPNSKMREAATAERDVIRFPALT